MPRVHAAQQHSRLAAPMSGATTKKEAAAAPAVPQLA
jgi:hypothetical protein